MINFIENALFTVAYWILVGSIARFAVTCVVYEMWFHARRNPRYVRQPSMRFDRRDESS